jgi:hypothetical protein
VRKKAYATHVHKCGHTVNGLARKIEVCGWTLRAFFRGDWKRLCEEKREFVRVALKFETMKALEQKIIKEWSR